MARTGGHERAIALRPVGDDDEGLLLMLYAQTRAEELARLPWSDEQKDLFVRHQFEAQWVDYATRFPGAEHSIITEGGEPAGRVWIDRRPGEIRMLDIIVDVQRQGRGIGTAVLGWLIDEATSAETALRHSVLRANQAAQRFYERLGFVVVEDFELYVLMEWRQPERL